MPRKVRVLRIETPTEEHDRLRAQRERIAAIYGHQPKQSKSGVLVTTSAPCVGHAQPMKAVARG